MGCFLPTTFRDPPLRAAPDVGLCTDVPGARVAPTAPSELRLVLVQRSRSGCDGHDGGRLEDAVALGPRVQAIGAGHFLS
eukprot:8446885-Heterocapsa_arctica.AAC.1